MTTDTWRPENPASEESLKLLKEQAGFPLPEAYLAQLRSSNGGEGCLSVEPGWISLWRAEEVLSMNSDYRVGEFAHGLWGFGSNGGGELLAFDLRGGQPYPVMMVPFIGMALSEAQQISECFDEFRDHIGRSAP